MTDKKAIVEMQDYLNVSPGDIVEIDIDLYTGEVWFVVNDGADGEARAEGIDLREV